MRGHIQWYMLSCDIMIQWRHLKVLWTLLAVELRLQGEEQVLSGQNESRLCWSGTFLTWLLYCCATLIISAIAFSPALSIIGTLKKHCTERVSHCKPKFLANKAKTAPLQPFHRAELLGAGRWGQKRLSQFVC